MENLNKQDNQVKKLSKRHLYTFGVGDFGFNAMMCMETNFFSAFLTDYARFPLVLAGIIMTITSIADTIASLLAGVILQKSKININNSGKYRSWLLFGPPIVAIFYILEFSKIGSESLSAAVICSGYIISHLICAIVYTAYISLLGKMSTLQTERTILSINKAQWNSAANIIFSYTAMTLVSFIAVKTSPVLGYTFTTGFWAILMVLSFWYVFSLSKGKDIEELSDKQTDNKKSSLSTVELLKLTMKNKPLLGLVGAEILRNTATFLMIGTAFYYFKYVLQDLDFLPIYLSIVAIMQFIGTLIVPKVALKFNKRQSYIIGMIGYAIFLFVARFIGSTSPWIFTALISCAQLVSRLAYSVNTALYSDTVVYGEYKTGVNTRGFIMSLLTVPIKVSMIVKGFALSTGLALIGYVADGPIVDSVVSGINNFMTLAPAAIAVLCVLLFVTCFKLSDSEVESMEQAINNK